MRNVAPMKIAKIGYLAVSAALCGFGIQLLLNPNSSLQAIGVACGISLILFGIIKLVGYFSKDLFRLAFENDLASGILMLAIGVNLLIRTQEVLASFATVLGMLILMDGLLKIQIAVEARPFGIRLWWLILASAIVTGVFGVLLIFRPSESQDMMMRFMGVALILDAELNASTVLTSVKIVRNQRAEA